MKPTHDVDDPDLVTRHERISQLGAEAVETAAGAAAGAAFGVLAGPVGAAAGAAFGAVVAAVLGHQAHGQEHEVERHFDALDKETESIREWRSTHPPPPPQPLDPDDEWAEDEDSMELEAIEDSLRG